jgi:proton-translocating NADH-quinone oxidoreductase chain N
VGFGFKASLVPFHQWVPDTYEGAPTPITGFLSTASKAAGFALLIRTMLVGLNQLSPDWLTVLTGVSIITMTFGNLVALRQTNLKRLLAYSSIAQAGYILIGLVAVPQSNLQILPFASLPINGINGVLIYLFGYLFTNLGAFAVVIAIENATGKVELRDYAGLMRRSPWLAVLMLIFLLSLAGIPPTLGFWGKYFVFGAAIQIEFYVLALVGLINAVIGAGYYLNIVRYMFLMPAEDETPIKIDSALNTALALNLAVVLLLGILPSWLIQWASESVQFLTSL